eukprot:TRINITY_DN1443_c1_g1_i1.p1 TRINITY_DN1443_c1_g1~~TRINITY_DN1443_c1_g1_i1.p1  ORF type:complete len:220 (+),score=69.60 TRINITY_DN1443_c1_g1_i1:45-704(+)
MCKSIFKHAGRKALDQILKMELIENASPPAIINLWYTHHEMMMQYWGRVLSGDAYDAMYPRLKANPYFVVPVFRDKGLFNVVTNFKTDEDIVLCCPLGEWQEKQDHASVHMTIQFFTELKQSKNLVLVRCELQDNHMTKQDAMFVTHCLMKYYTMPKQFEFVETFNKNPSQFNYHNYLRAMKLDAEANTGKGGNIEILEEKKTWLTDAYKKPPPTASSA